MKWGKNIIGLGIAVILGLSLILIPVASRLSPVQAAVTWTKSGEVTLDSELHVVDTWVIKESSTSYKMWYTHVKKDLSISDIIGVIKGLSLDNIASDITNLDLEQFLNHLSDLAGAEDVSTIAGLLDDISTVIGYATSTNGRTWTKVNSEVLAGSSSAAWDSVGAPCVIWDATDSKYKMWYTHSKTDISQPKLQTLLTGIANPDTRKAAILDFFDGTTTVIEYTTSSNGVDWGARQEVLAGSDNNILASVGDPCVFKFDGTYYMLYTRVKTDLTRDDLDVILTNISDFGIADFLDILDGTNTVIEIVTSNDGITWGAPQEVLTGSGMWNSVADPCVIISGSSIEIWYTNVKTDLLRANLYALADEIKGLGISTLWNSLKTNSLADFIVDLVALDIDDIKSVLSNTSTVIGYATATMGEAGVTVQNPQHLVGSSGSPWSSVAAPSVVKTGSKYEMWYTEGISDLTWQNLLALALGDNLPIGYAYYTPSRPSGPGPRPPPPGITDVSDVVTGEGVFTEEVIAKSEDENVSITIDEGNTGLTAEGEPLSEISIIEMEEPPAPPEDSNVIGLAYDFGPDGATFSPPITIEFTVDPATLPPDVALEDLVIAYYDETLVPPAWVELPTTFDPATNTLMADVSHFTAFAIITVVPAVAPPAPAAFSVSSLSVQPAEVEPSEITTVSIVVANTGGESGSYTVVLKIDGVKEAEERVTIADGSSQTVSFSVIREEAGSYTVLWTG